MLAPPRWIAYGQGSGLVMPVVAFPMLFVFWPKLWFDPYRAVADYFQFHLQHDHYMQWYFGQPLEVPPFPVALVRLPTFGF